jgi:hypothetical protein
MSTPGNPVVMVDPQGNVGQVAADKVESARSSGYRDAVKMVGPDGKQGYVATDKVDAARQNNFMVAPDSGIKMATPDGKITYALPSEVDKFSASGHTRINPDGSYLVMPLPGEEYQQTISRAKNVMKALGAEDQKKAQDAEMVRARKNLTSPNPLRNPLIAGPLAGAGTAAAITGLGEGLGAAGEAIASTTEGQYFLSSPRLYAQWALKAAAKSELAKTAVKYAIKGGAAYLGYRWLGRLLTGGL